MARLLFVFGIGVLGLALLGGVGETQEKKETGKKAFLPPGWKALNLSVEQRSKMHDVQTGYRSKIGEHTKAIKILQEQERQDLVKLLTDDQKAHLLKITTGGEAKTEKKSEDKK